MAPRRSQHTEQDIAYAISLFFAVRRTIRTKLAQGRKLDPSTWLQIETMKFIADHAAPKMKDIATHLSITAPSTTSLIGGLVKSRLVVCRADPDDRRTSRIMLTKKGNAKLKRAITDGIRNLSGLFAVLPDAELRAFIQALEHLQTGSR